VPVKRTALLAAAALVLSACVPSQARDQIEENEARIIELEAALAAATATTVVPAPSASTAPSPDVTMVDLPATAEPVAIIAEAVGPAVVQIEAPGSIGRACSSPPTV
jgi:hypothetical protein